MARPSDEPVITKSATEARQGVNGHNVRIMLATSLGGAVVLLAVVYYWFFSS